MLFDQASPEYEFILHLVPFFANASDRILEQVFLKQLQPVWFDRFPYNETFTSTEGAMDDMETHGDDTEDDTEDDTGSLEDLRIWNAQYDIMKCVGAELRRLIQLGTAEASYGWETELTVDADRERRRIQYRMAFNAGSPLPQGHQYEVVLEDYDHARTIAREAAEQELQDWTSMLLVNLRVPESGRRSSVPWVDVDEDDDDDDRWEYVSDQRHDTAMANWRMGIRPRPEYWPLHFW
ncbi:hypothetical protein Hypma_005433 [Hypsizygus marmoreus]|uniref:Uncharacterized protein n=1 Tax=Hypsizygus marmoreus TaxID=39966 RepID=A0A369IZ64_HYPMA|nr:hypothetical protein Hypma_005433 [Hypsizygus marmoreus]